MKHLKYNYKAYNSMNSTLDKKKVLIIVAVILAVLIVATTVITIVLLTNKEKPVEPENNEMEITGITVSYLPNKTIYYVGEALDIEGLRVFTNRKGGAFLEVDIDECTITGFDSSIAVERQIITVTYKGFTDTFAVTIKHPLSATPVLVKIEMENLPKTQYKVGELLNIEGGTFIATYSDGTTKTIKLANKHVYGFKAAYDAGVGEYDITVKYSKDGVEVQTTYKITITE